MRSIFLFLLLLAAGRTFSQTEDENAIRAIMASQTDCWNKGDLDKFMQGYWHSDSLMFVGKNGITYGYTNTLNNYKKKYSGSDQMGRLSFTLLRVDRLSDVYYSVVGKWFLKRKTGDIGGIYTLLFRKIDGKWWIIQDHSS